MKLSIKVTTDIKNMENEFKTCPFIYEYDERNSPSYRLYSCSMTYYKGKMLMEAKSFGAMTYALEKMGFENISMLIKDREMLDKVKYLEKKHGFMPIEPPTKKDIDEVQEGLEFLNNQNK